MKFQYLFILVSESYQNMKWCTCIIFIFSITILKVNAISFYDDTVIHYHVQNGLQPSVNKHYLVDAKTGKPVFILATTAWNINALTYTEIDTLLQSIAGNGFNSIMFALDFYPQADEPNVYGHKAYTGTDKTDLDSAYFIYCDYIIDHCTKLGIYPMLYTMWSGKTTGIMNTYTPGQLFILGKKIGERYRKNRNVILVAGGESSPPYIDTARVNAMGMGLKEGSAGNNLVTVHPTSPHSNSEYYAHSVWLDFYMSQGKSNINGIGFDLTKAVSKDYNLPVVKPTMVGEHRYESGTKEDPLIQRRSLYLSIFAGSFGYAYGHNALWQMTPHTAQPWMLKSWAAGVINWKEALHTEASKQLANIKKLLYAYPYLQRIPDATIITSIQSDSIAYRVEAMRDGNYESNNASYIMVYISSPGTVSIKTSIISAKKLNIYWFDPATGKSELLEKNIINIGAYTSKPKTDRKEKDGVLVINSAGSKYHL